MREEKKRAALYVRVSTEEQAKEGVSIDEQLQKLRHFAKYKGWDIWNEFIDDGWSGKDDNRPALRRLMQEARDKHVDMVAVTKLDRFMRNTRLLLNYVDDLKNLGIGFAAGDDNIDTTDGKTGDLMLTILAAVAQWERERIGERIKDARRFSKGQGRWLMGRTLYGYRWNKEAQRFELVEDEAKIVKMIYDWYTSKKDLGMMKIADKLNDAGYRTRTGKHWREALVKYVLCHPAYADKAQPYSYPAIIDEATCHAAERQREQAKRVKKDSRSWLLQGMVVCGLCGHRLGCRQKDSRHSRKYVCRGREKDAHMDGSERCSLPKIYAEWLEREVWSKFAAAVSDSGVLRQSIKDAMDKLEDRKKEMEAISLPINKKLEKVTRRIEKLVFAWTRAEDDLTEESRDRFEEELANLKREKAELEARKANLNPETHTEVSRLKDYIASVKRILDTGGLVVQTDGIWAYGFNEAEYFGSGPDVEEILDRVTHPPEQRPTEVVEKDGVIHFEMEVDRWAFEHPKEARIRMMRNLLSWFDIKVFVYDNRVEVGGLIPTQILRVPSEASGRKWGRGFNSPY